MTKTSRSFNFIRELRFLAIVFLLFNTISIAILLTVVPKNKIVNVLSKMQRSNRDLIDFETHQLFSSNNIQSLVKINNLEKLSSTRKELIKYVFGKSKIPVSTNIDIKSDIKDERYSNLLNCKKINQIKITMSNGITSVAYKFFPLKNNNNKLIIYNQGHLGDFSIGKNSIEYFLAKGYEVIAFSMPLIGDKNSNPKYYVDNIGYMTIDTHDKLEFITHSDKSSSLKYFVHPISIALDYSLKNKQYESISMVGISGGGWTTTLSAALDTRINYSFPVAGTLPIFLRTYDFNDSENWTYDLYSYFNYLDLYILGSSGNRKRSQIQILNKYDSCCYAGNRWKYYRNDIISIVDKIASGSFDIYVDESHNGHKISSESLDYIHSHINKNDNNKI